MKKALKALTKKVNSWLKLKKPVIKAEIKSIVQTFLGSIALYLVINWGVVTTTGFDVAAMLGIASAALRAGVKGLWILLEPQILWVLKWLISFLPSKK